MAKIAVIGSRARSLVNFRGPLLKAMIDRGHNVFACAPRALDSTRKILDEIGVAYRDIDLSRSGLNPFEDLATLRHLLNIFRELRPDLVITYTIKPVIYGSLAARYIQVPSCYSIITGLGYSFGNAGAKQRLVGIMAKAFYKWALKNNDKVFFQNPDDRALFENLGLVGKHQSVLISGSGVDTDYFMDRPLPRTLSFLLLSRLIREKGIIEYLEAAQIVKRRYPQTVFRLGGWFDTTPTAVKEKELRPWIERGIVDYLGTLEDVRPSIANSLVYVLPSYREGTPRTVLEAMAMGRPVITSNAPGCKETVRRVNCSSAEHRSISLSRRGVIEGENGFLVPVRDVEALASSMEAFILFPNLAASMGKASRRMAEEKYDVRLINRVILDAIGI